MRGGCPTHLVLCHKMGRTHLRNPTHIPIPPLKDFIKLNEDVASVCGSLSNTKSIGIAINTFGFEEAEARQLIDQTEAETSIPTTDVIRYGVAKIGQQLLGA